MRVFMSNADVPADSLLSAKYGCASYQDCFSASLDASDARGPVGLFFGLLHPAPKWVTMLMAIRNFCVQFVGLKSTDEGGFGIQKPEAEYEVGDKIDFFKITNLSKNEVIVTAHDSHLDSFFSMYIKESDGRREVFMTSVVETKGRLGNIYMFVIAPFHRLIVRRSLKRLSS